MTDEAEIRKIEQRGYSKGYAAGKRSREQDVDYERLEREKWEFIDRAFLAALPYCLENHVRLVTCKASTKYEASIEAAWHFARISYINRRTMP